jgi:uncharacterized protein (TIGR03790 family)
MPAFRIDEAGAPARRPLFPPVALRPVQAELRGMSVGPASRLQRPFRRAGWILPCLLCVTAVILAAAEPAKPAGADEGLASRVVLLANSDDPDSLRIANHYAAVRGVPRQNLIVLPMPAAESISWREFLDSVWTPLLAELVRGQWIDAIPMTTTDGIGRLKHAPYGHRIAALVVCRGVPLKIAHDPALYTDALPYTSRNEFRTNAGAVDAELSLLALPNYPINAFVPNPLFQNESPTKFEEAQIVRVARLDGPTANDALALVDRAVAAERSGLLGRAYVDISNRDPVGNGWLEAVDRQLQDLGFDRSVDREPATMPATARFDAPALYFGWYSGSVDGPFLLPGFQFPPGAIALHIHSYSAVSLRSATSGWTAPLVARGVTATVGNVNEPYLELTHRPHLLLRSLAKGRTLVEAAYFSLRAVSWQAILIGDPLYRPFAVPLETQLGNLAGLPPALAGYAVLRRMNELDERGRQTEATALLARTQREAPGLAVGLALAQRLSAAGDADAAANALGFVPLLKIFPADQWALVREAARLIEASGRPGRALEVWRTLLDTADLPPALRLGWLREARATAIAAGDAAQGAAWQTELEVRAALADEKNL